MHPEAAHVAETLLAYPSCLIATHVNPEGDALGSMLALALALEQRGKMVYCFDKDGVPDICRFLPGWERVQTELPAQIPPLVVYVDANNLERCGIRDEQVAGAQTFVRIDHHLGGEEPEAMLVDTTAAAAGELIFELLPLLGAQLTREIATNLQAALMVDTGRFTYANTTPRTHRIAAELVAAGADVSTIVEWTWGRVKFSAMKLLGLALSSLRTSPDRRIAWAVLRQEDFDATEANPGETEGIIDHVRVIRGAEVAILFSEKNGAVRASLRSTGGVDVAEIARRFNGGGHKRAAGLTYEGLLEEAEGAVLKAIEEKL